MDKADKLDLKQSTRRPFKSRDLAFSREVNRQGQRNRAIHYAMWIKLVNSGISSKVVTIIKSIYNKITASIKLSSDISACFDICLGLKQGEPLSPLLIVIFINDVRHQLENGPEGTIGGIDIDRLCFCSIICRRHGFVF